MEKSTFLDANVFMYAAGAPHAYKAPRVRILSDVETDKLAATVDTEIFQELLYRYHHINLADKGVLLCRDILKYRMVILPVDELDIREAIDLYDPLRNIGVKPRDVVHAAVMKNHGISKVISADKHFDHFDFLTRIDPLSYNPSN